MNILVIPDVQAKPRQKLEHLRWLMQYVAKHRPDVIVCLGDLGDFPSLSSYDKGKAAAENKRLHLDVAAFKLAAGLITPKIRGYNPRLIYTAGNHEYRIKRYESANQELQGSLFDPLEHMTNLGWEAYPFLEVATAAGISFSHFFTKTRAGTTTAGSCKNGPGSAAIMLVGNRTSCVAGHKQGLDTAMFPAKSGRQRAIIAGSFYTHNEGYQSPQGHDYWRGVLMLNNARAGDFDLTEVSLNYLRRKYG